jgi:hypothetical protein
MEERLRRFIVVSPHTADECEKLFRDIAAAGYRTHVDFGCKDGDHTGYCFLEATSHEQALMLVPALIRDKAKAIRLVHAPAIGEDKIHQK